MSEEERRKILERVASGDLPPADAADLIAAIDRRTTTATANPEPHAVNSVQVIGTFRTLRIDGDPAVKSAVAEGPHRVRVENGTMIFDPDPDSDEPGYVLFGPRHQRDPRLEEFQTRRRHGTFGWRGGAFEVRKPPVLTIRMNPDLPLEVQMTAGSARVRGVHGPIIADLTAGSARFEGVRAPFRAEVDAGSVNVSGKFDRGESAIRCTAGSVRLRLEKGSSVSITARSTFGKISLPGGRNWQGIGGGKQELTIGAGDGRLDLEATTGAVAVEAE